MNSSTTLNPTPSAPTAELQPLLVTEPEACRILGVGRTTIFHLRREGRLRSVLVKTHKHNVSGRRMYRVSDLSAYVEGLVDVVP